jgi:Cof subfamily protein (haloacid dehalogenase superfamily)
MNHKIKMIGLDMDGTLLTTEKKLTTYTKQILQKAIEQGIEIVLSTGRSITGIPQELLEMPGMRYAVTINGARIIDLQRNEVIHKNTLPMEKALELLDIIGEFDAIQEAFIDSVCYSSKDKLEHANDYFLHPSTAEYVIKSRTPVENVKATVIEMNSPVDKVNGQFRNAEDKKKSYELLNKVSGVVIVSSLGSNWEINAEGTDKGTAMLKLGELLGIRREEIMACGDGMNDIAMLKAVGLGVAMENAEPEVREAADYITTSNDEDGVAKAIEKFVLE